jgi:hypothetical protein
MSDKLKQVKVLFTSWNELEDEKRERTGEQKELVAEAGRALDAKAGDVGKIFGFWKKLVDKGIDELEILNALADKMKS